MADAEQPYSSGKPTLILVPTELERRGLTSTGAWQHGTGLFELAGFGPIAAAARTAELLARLTPGRVLLLGIAGSFDVERLPVGSAGVFDGVELDGVGAGSADARVGSRELGWPQWPGSSHAKGGPVWDVLAWGEAGPEASRLLTVCSASASPAEAADRRKRFPQATAEDMEGFGVALACAMQAVPLRIVRGISNVVGERDRRRWRIDEALAAASVLGQELLARRDSWTVPRPGSGTA